MLKKFKYIVITVALSANLLNAFGGSGDAGTLTGAFLKIGSSARGAAMGDAYSALCEDASAFYYNPAGLNFTGRLGFSLMHAIWFEGVSYETLGMNMDLGTAGKLGAGVQYLAYGALAGADTLGTSTGDFFPGDLAISASYARNISGYDLGITAKYISLTIAQTASTFAFDLGVIKKLKISDTDVSVAFTAKNLGLPVSFGSISEGLAGSFNLGAALSPVRDFKLAVEISFPWDNPLFIMAGGEYTLMVGTDIDIEFRAGYNARSAQAGELGGLTTGFGVNSGEYSLDYAFIPIGNLGYTHRISISAAFGMIAGPVTPAPARKFGVRKK
ncbi:MAG: PorV/PorQ family protein [Candidatus Firestonebacteria bacterium]